MSQAASLSLRSRVAASMVLIVLVSALFATRAHAQVRYVDENGVAHWVQSPEQVPEKYRGSADRPQLPGSHLKELDPKVRAEREREQRKSEREQARRADAEVRAALTALSALRTLESTTSVGVTYQSYLTRLADAKIAFDQSGVGASLGRAGREAMAIYVVAAQAWEARFKGDDFEADNIAARAPCRLRYGVRYGGVSELFTCASEKIRQFEAAIAAASR